ncbi:hypothetical protein [Streptomyces sp. MMG1533]|uniref:hypothetical protein n=1 Tax=Streptomyces sp. MMG1533 TaxID=1415546 RepID=UPI000B2104CB
MVCFAHLLRLLGALDLGTLTLVARVRLTESRRLRSKHVSGALGLVVPRDIRELPTPQC